MKKNGVICAIDVNDFDQDVVNMAAEFAKQFGVDLDVLHVSLLPDPANAAWPFYLGSPKVIIRDNRALRTVESEVGGVQINRHHLSGIPVEKILEFDSANISALQGLAFTYSQLGREAESQAILNRINLLNPQ